MTVVDIKEEMQEILVELGYNKKDELGGFPKLSNIYTNEIAELVEMNWCFKKQRDANVLEGVGFAINADGKKSIVRLYVQYTDLLYSLKVQENFTLRGWILSIEQRIIESFSNNK